MLEELLNDKEYGLVADYYEDLGDYKQAAFYRFRNNNRDIEEAYYNRFVKYICKGNIRIRFYLINNNECKLIDERHYSNIIAETIMILMDVACDFYTVENI